MSRPAQQNDAEDHKNHTNRSVTKDDHSKDLKNSSANTQFTLGIEEEYLIIDPQTRELSADAERILPRARETLGDVVEYELLLSQVEVASPICTTLADVEQTLIKLRTGVIQAAHEIGRAIASSGTHPFSSWRDQAITPKEHYYYLVENYRQLIREQVIFGCHIHVGLSDREIAIQVANHARLWLAPLLAISANSPFWLGEDTGYASFRSGLWWMVPLSGPPPHFSSYEQYQQFITTLVDNGSIDNPRSVYWDIRLSDRFPTIEFRVMDVCLTVSDAVLIAGLVRALVHQCYELVQRKQYASAISTEILRVASWRAARYGLSEKLFDPHTQQLLPARDVITHLLNFVRPALEATNDWEPVSSGLARIFREGNGAQRQRAVFEHTNSLQAVVDFLIDETRPN